MGRLSIAHGLFTWQDGRPAVEAALQSTAGIVDHVLIADGLIHGVPDLGLPHLSEFSWLQDARYLPPYVPINAKEWTSLSMACSWLLERARVAGADWLLFIDADQELHNGELLQPWLEEWRGDVFPIPRQDSASNRIVAPWQLIRVAAFRRYVSGCYVLEHMDGRVLSIVPEGPPPETLSRYLRVPWISHHPERRPPWRYHHRLGELETILEPPPSNRVVIAPSELIQLPRMSEPTPEEEPVTEPAAPDPEVAASTPPVLPAYYCPGCGTRYFGPGTCVNQHAAIELERDPSVAVPSDSAGADECPPKAPQGAAGSEADTAPAEPAPVNPDPVEPAPVVPLQPSDVIAKDAAPADPTPPESAASPAEPSTPPAAEPAASGTDTPTPVTDTSSSSSSDPANPLDAAIMALEVARQRIDAAFDSIENAIRVAIENPPA